MSWAPTAYSLVQFGTISVKLTPELYCYYVTGSTCASEISDCLTWHTFSFFLSIALDTFPPVSFKRETEDDAYFHLIWHSETSLIDPQNKHSKNDRELLEKEQKESCTPSPVLTAYDVSVLNQFWILTVTVYYLQHLSMCLHLVWRSEAWHSVISSSAFAGQGCTF